MKRMLIGALAASLALAFGACGSTPSSAPAAAGPTANPNYPSWLSDLPPSDELWGIGSANLADPSLAMQAAEARARVAITRQIDVSVKSMFTNYQSAAGSGTNMTSLTSVEDVSRQITNMNLQGAEPNKRDQTPDGTWWVRVRISKASATGQAAAIFDSEAARYANYKKDEAMNILNSELEKNKPEDYVVNEG